MLYRLLADATVLLHLAFVLFVVLGGLLVYRAPSIAWLHLPGVAWAVWIELAGRLCPLTPLENHFRRLAGQVGYGGGFVEHYIVPLIYPGELTRAHQIALGVAVLVLNLAVYGWFAFTQARDS